MFTVKSAVRIGCHNEGPNLTRRVQIGAIQRFNCQFVLLVALNMLLKRQAGPSPAPSWAECSQVDGIRRLYLGSVKYNHGWYST